MKKIYRHKCHVNHINYRVMARCVFPYSVLYGDAGYGALLKCGKWVVELYSSAGDAIECAKHECGHNCVMNHDVFELMLPGEL